MKTCNTTKRPKAFLGTLIGLGSLAAGVYTTIANANNQKKLAAEQAYEAEHANNIKAASQMTQGFRAQDDSDREYLRQFNLLSKGGKRKLRNTPYITDGGYAIPIDNHTYLLRGAKHSEGGIGIKAGNKEFEAEDGEVLERTPNSIKVYSANQMLDGESPAEEVLKGADKNTVFKRQQAYKRRLGLKDDGTRADLGARWYIPDYIGLGSNIAASVLSNVVAQGAYKDLAKYAPTRPESYYAGRYRTTYNINPQLAENKLERDRAFEDSMSNRASSVAALDERRRIGTLTATENNKLWADKQNKETELVNANVLNQQEVANKNIEAYNNWRQSLAEYRRGLAAQRIESNVGMIQGIGSSIGGFLQSGIDNYQADQARKMLVSSSQYGSAERMASMGVKFSKPEMNSLLNNAEDMLKLYKDDNTPNGIKEYNAALQRYNFWRNRLGMDSSTDYNIKSLASMSNTPK